MRRAALLCLALACWGRASPPPAAPLPSAAPHRAAAAAVTPAPAAASAPAPPHPRPPTDVLYSPDDDDDPLPSDIEDDEDQDTNTTERGMFLGAPCEFTCNSKLHHVFCDPITGHCECEKKYPVRLGTNKGCAKPKNLGEQCFYRQACKYMDTHASCVQINHNAICQCESGFHSVSYSKPVRKVFCTEDMALLTSDVHTLLGVCSGIAMLAGLLCLVLHLYTRGRIQHNIPPGHYADASLSPPMLFTSETGDKMSGIPLAVQGGRPSSRSSQRSAGAQRASPSPMGAPSRAGAARAAAILLISCHMPERRALSLPAAGDTNTYRRRKCLTTLCCIVWLCLFSAWSVGVHITKYLNLQPTCQWIATVNVKAKYLVVPASNGYLSLLSLN